MTELFPCPLCGKREGYVITHGQTFSCWWLRCADIDCNNIVATSTAEYYKGSIPKRTARADDEWNRKGRYAERMRRVLLAMAEGVNYEQAMLLAHSALRGNGNKPEKSDDGPR